MTDELQPKTNGRNSSEYRGVLLALGLLAIVMLGEAVINAYMRVQTGEAYDAISDVTFGVFAGFVSLIVGVYQTGRVSKKNTLAKATAAMPNNLITTLAEKLVEKARAA